jgi:predicted nucleic acid-binding protein
MLRGQAPARWLLAWIAAQALAHGALLGTSNYRIFDLTLP